MSKNVQSREAVDNLRKVYVRKLSDHWQRLRSNRRLRCWVHVVSFVVPLAFVLLLLSRSVDDLRRLNDWPSYLGALGVGVLLYPLSFVTQAVIWQRIIARLSRSAGGWHDLEIYARTYFFRRVPGAVWYLVGRTLMYQTRGVGARVTLTASGLEWGLLIVASAITFVATSLARAHHAWVVLPCLAGLCFVCALALARLFNRLDQVPMPGWLRARLSSLAPGVRVLTADVVLWLGLFLWAYFVGGLILYVLLHGVVSGFPVSVLDAWRAWSLAGGVGLVFSSVVPAGMGVRELTIAGVLAPQVPASISLIVSILLRVVFVVGDLVWGGLLWAAGRWAVRATDRPHRVVEDEESA